MKIGDKIKAVGYMKVREDEDPGWPEFLEEGNHQIAKIKQSGFGILIKTDRHPEWINLDWFSIR